MSRPFLLFLLFILHRICITFSHISLRAKKPVHREKYPDVCRTWGDWIKVRSLDLKLTKRQLSVKLNVSDVTIYLWEKNLVKPSLAQIPKIIEFVGGDPFEKKAENLGERIREYRRIHGLSQKSLARLLGIDASTIGAWEKSKSQPMKTNLLRLLSILCG